MWVKVTPTLNKSQLIIFMQQTLADRRSQFTKNAEDGEIKS
jgi:hypothetical protein